MKKSIKKYVSFVLSIVLCFSMAVPALAAEPELPIDDNQHATLMTILHDVELAKAAGGLEEIDFTDLCIGEPIQRYAYVDGAFTSLGVMYPLTVDGELLMWAVEDVGGIRVSQALVREVRDAVGVNQEFCIVYDRNACHMYSNGAYTVLNEYDNPITEYSVLPTSVSMWNRLSTTSLSECVSLGYSTSLASSTMSPRTAGLHAFCSVRFVDQNTIANSKICWAASAASIINYKKGTSYTAVQVAQRYFNSTTNYNQPLSTYLHPGVLANYGLSYTYLDLALIDEVIYDNLNRGYPILATFKIAGTTNTHAVAIYCINTIVEYGKVDYILVMDPDYGFETVNKTNGYYAYTSTAYPSATLDLFRGVCYRWNEHPAA